MRRGLVAFLVMSALALVTPASLAETPAPPLLSAGHLVTFAHVEGDQNNPTTMTGTAFGPDVPLATITARWGYVEANDEFGCDIVLEQTMYWTIDDGAGNVLHGQMLSGGAFGTPDATFVLKATGGTGEFAGWSGWGTFQGIADTADCALSFYGEWKVNRV
jgi:hypothetical protein